MKTTYLSSKTPLTKSFELENGELKKISHPRVIEVTSYEETWSTIEELHEQICRHAHLGHCLLKGNVTRKLTEESRANTTNNTEPTWILCFDLDGLKEIKDVEDFMYQMGLADVDYIVQYSSSMGIVEGRGLSAHIFVILSKPWPPGMLKEWLIHKNLSLLPLRNNLLLTRTCNALKWGLDVSTCQNDKLIYIAPPILGPGVIDSFKEDRIQLIKRKTRTFELTGKIPSAEANRIEAQKALNALRVKEGLPELKKITTKTMHNVEYQANPGKSIVTSIKQERGFVYLNLNGGDSWGYYHPENNPEFILNFKGEPIYKTAELLPEYWASVRDQQVIPKTDTEGKLYLVFRDFRTSHYHNIIWDEANQTLVEGKAKNKEQLVDFLVQHKQKIPPYIPDWNIIFAPHNDKIIDIENKLVNTFIPTQYMKVEKRKKVTEIPPTIYKVINNVVGGDKDILERFMNSLACIVQYRQRTSTCWLFHGVPGTGKGMMLSKILMPIIGAKYTFACRQKQLQSQFNDMVENKLLLWIDEMNIKVVRDEVEIVGDLKNYVTEEEIAIRKLYTPVFQAKNYMTIIMVGNDGEILRIPPGDRRFNVGIYQTQPLRALGDTEEMVKQIALELEDFAAYLWTREADMDLARLPVDNEAKKLVMAEGETSIEQTAKAILSGDFQYFWDARQVIKNAVSSVSRDQLAGSFKAQLKAIAEGKRAILFREEIQDIFEYMIGGMPSTPHKFTSMVKHHQIYWKSVSRDGEKGRGLEINWNIPEDLKKEALK